MAERKKEKEKERERYRERLETLLLIKKKEEKITGDGKEQI